MKKTFLLYATIALLFLTPFRSAAQAPAQCTDIMLQSFYWKSHTESNWVTLATKVIEIAPNFSLVWLAPSADDNDGDNGYMPIEYFNQTSKFGTATDLKALIASFKSNGTGCVADVILNHRNGNFYWADFPDQTYKGITYHWGGETICNNDELKNATAAQQHGITPTGAADTGESTPYSRDIDHTNANVRATFKAYLDFLRNEIGYAAYRFDFTKGYRGSYVKEYTDAVPGTYAVGEYFDGSYANCVAWIDAAGKSSATFDFPCKYQLNKAFSNNDLTQLVWKYGNDNQPAGLIHHPTYKRYSTTFIDNHDTYRDQNKFNGDVLQAYAFLMSSPGVPCVFLPHWTANQTAIAAMCQARKAVKLHSESAITVNQSSNNSYVATATGLNGTLIVKIGSGAQGYSVPSGYAKAASGTNYEMWIKTNTPVAPTLTVTPGAGTYYTGQTVTMSATDNASIYYTTDGSTPTASSTKYAAAIALQKGTTSIKAIAINANGQSNVYGPAAYNVVDKPSYILLGFKAPSSWTSVKAYVWEGASTALAGTWPGLPMVKNSNGYWYYKVSNFTANTINAVFNNGSDQQTVDLSASASTCWDYSGTATPYSATVVVCQPTDVENATADAWDLYPNPTRGNVQFSIPANASKITVTSALGAQMQVQSSIVDEKAELNLSSYPAGIYYITVWTKEGSKQTKAVVKM